MTLKKTVSAALAAETVDEAIQSLLEGLAQDWGISAPSWSWSSLREEISGQYLPSRTEIALNRRMGTRRPGSTQEAREFLVTVAHEMRHHWQSGRPEWAATRKAYKGYKQIGLAYLEQPEERDAISFEKEVAEILDAPQGFMALRALCRRSNLHAISAEA